MSPQVKNCKDLQPKSLHVSKSQVDRKMDSIQSSPDAINIKSLPPDLAEIMRIWPNLPEHVRQAIVTLVSSVTVTAREGDEVV